ncbi:MAG: NADH-quinone oxidoreductase subunit C [Bacteroidia bacterium]
MTREELKFAVTGLLPGAAYEEAGEFLNVLIPAADLKPLMTGLRQQPVLDFDYLYCLTCIDWKDHLLMVYHLLSKKNKHELVVKAKIADIRNPEIESMNGIWKTAELLEDEVFDLFGVNFLNHPNLRRLFLEADWKGFPLRKNYTDENMIKL